MESTKKVKKKFHIEKVNIHCVATSDGYFGGRIVKEGTKFMYNDVLKDGKLPLWCQALEKFECKFDKLDPVADVKDMFDEAPKAPEQGSDLNDLV